MDEDYLSRISSILRESAASPDGSSQDAAPESTPHDQLGETLTLEFRRLLSYGETISLGELRSEFPEQAEALEEAHQRAIAEESVQAPGAETPDEHPNLEHTTDHPSSNREARAPSPQTLGRYRIRETIGSGGFGVVYKSWDDQLQRLVAIKVARHFTDGVANATAYLEEARLLAKLDHPGIVPVYDVGQTPDGAVYVVSKFLDGADLAHRSHRSRWDFRDAAQIVAKVADALNFAHHHGVVHRDVKPGNIILAADDEPILVDFGLAIRESEFGSGSRFVGTPAFMSPEQARREGHRVDGRSDIYSLGAVFYRLLTGRRPFRAASLVALLEMIRNVEVRPPRQLEQTVPRELERICLKALSKRLADRYSTASDMADDLRHWLTDRSAPAASPPTSDVGSTDHSLSVSDDLASQAVVPRGLRAFEDADADFFLHLLPGPRDRDGIPECVRFWKTRIEETESDNTFSVGVLLGPSGSGKSSLVRAGILPRLNEQTVAIIVDTREQDVEKRLLRQIRKRIPSLESATSLHEAMFAIRRHRGVQAGRKLLLVFDQFEQWLSHHHAEETGELVDALRQCDGARAQALLLIRDDFTLDAAHFMDRLEEPLSQTRNFATVDLFGKEHAKNVLIAFGRAFGALPAQLPREQQRFIEAAVDGLAENNQIIPIRLSLFADMVKDRPWTMATLREYGGARGLGVAFLEEKLDGATAHPFIRAHNELTRRLLQALLPDDDAVIKGRARTHEELISHFSRLARPDTLDRLLALLDSELRLITPTGFDATGSSQSGSSQSSASSSQEREPAYQLAHDYLVPTIRSWLNAAERSTRRGRVRLRLRELAESWAAKPEPRRLPSLFEWCNIHVSTASRDWTAQQKQMMRVANRRVGTRLALLTMLIAGLGFLAYEATGRLQAAALRNRLLDADTSEAPEIIGEMKAYGKWVRPQLQRELQASGKSEVGELVAEDDGRAWRRRLNLALALAETDPSQRDYLQSRLDRMAPDELWVAASFLPTVADDAEMWRRLLDDVPDSRRLAVASILARRAPEDPRWSAAGEQLAAALSRVRPFQLPDWIRHFHRVRKHLVPHFLSRLELEPDANRGNLIELLAIYGQDDPAVLAAGIEHANGDEFAALLQPLKRLGATAATELRRRIERRMTVDAGPTRLPPVSEAATSQLQQFDGFLEAGVGLAHAVPLEQFSELARQLAVAGYRPTSYRLYGKRQETWVSACWIRDGREFRVAHGLTADQWRAADQQHREDGLYLRDIAIHPPHDSPAAPARFAGLWVAAPSPQVESQVASQVASRGYVDKPYSEHHQCEDEWSDFQLSRCALRVTEQGPLYSAVWTRRGEDSGAFFRSRHGRSFGDVYPGYLQTDCRLSVIDPQVDDTFDFHLGVQRNETKNTSNGQAHVARYRNCLGDYAGAKSVLDRLAKLAPTNAKVCEWRATALAGLKDLEGLTAEVARYEKLKGSPAVLSVLRIRQAVLAGDVAEAESQWKSLEAVQTSEPDTESLVALARGAALLVPLLRETQPAKAAELEERAVQWIRSARDDQRGSRAEFSIQEPDFSCLRSLPSCQQLIRELGEDRRFDAVWQATPKAVSQLILPASIDEHLAQGRRAARSGFTPVCVETRFDPASGRLAAVSVWSREVADAAQQQRRAQRLAALALALAHFGEAEYLTEVLRGIHGREVGSFAVETAPRVGLSPQVFADAFRQGGSDAQRRSLLLVLGGFPAAALSAGDHDYFANRLPALVSSSADAGLRSAAYWCGRRWGMVDGDDWKTPFAVADRGRDGPNWRINSLGQTMVVLRPGETLIGSPFYEPDRESSEQLGWVRFQRGFSLAATEVTVEQFRQFLEDPVVRQQNERAKKFFSYSQQYAPHDDCPQVSVNWYFAARFCQWLSEKENVPEDQWCYPGIGDLNGKFVLPDNFLSRTGYRLPTEAEWEYAARAGGGGSRHYGESVLLLPAYGWFVDNSDRVSHPVARLKPNEFGLFDMLGNAIEWCQEPFAAYRIPADDYARTDDEPATRGVGAEIYRVLRGGSYDSRPGELRSADRRRQVPTTNSTTMGFRLARTVVADAD